MSFLDNIKDKLNERTDAVKSSSFASKFTEAKDEAGNFVGKVSSVYRKKTIPILCGALVFLVLVLAVALLLGGGVEKTANSGKRSMMDQVRSKNIVVCNIDSINAFFKNYYTALSEGDTTTMDSLFDNPQKAKITTSVSTIVDNYSDIKVYVTPGIHQNEVVAFVSNNINFNNINVPAPAVDSFYLYVDAANKTVKIMTDMYTDKDINTFLTLVSYREPIRSLLSSTEDALYGALENNNDLRNLYVVMSSMTSEASGSGK